MTEGSIDSGREKMLVRRVRTYSEEVGLGFKDVTPRALCVRVGGAATM